VNRGAVRSGPVNEVEEKSLSLGAFDTPAVHNLIPESPPTTST